MPVTIELPRLFSDRLGEQAGSEPVEWFNAVDALRRLGQPAHPDHRALAQRVSYGAARR